MWGVPMEEKRIKSVIPVSFSNFDNFNLYLYDLDQCFFELSILWGKVIEIENSPISNALCACMDRSLTFLSDTINSLHMIDSCISKGIDIDH